MPNIISSIEIWIGDSFGHFLGWKMPKMLKFRKIQFQISGQWFELGGSYFEVKIALPKASIGDLIFEKCFHWLTLVKDCCLSKYCTSQGFSWIWDQLQINTKVEKNHSVKTVACLYQSVWRYEAPKLGKAGLRFRKWKVEIFDFFGQKNIFQVKSIGYEVTLLYQFLFLKELLAIEN